MRTTYFLAAIAALALVFASCKKAIKPSDDISIESRQLTGFTKLDVSDAMDVEVTFSNQEEVMVEANSNLHQYILTDVVNGTLKIRMKNNVRIKSGAEIKVYVSALAMEAVQIDDASRVEFLTPAVASSFDLNLSGASTFQGGLTTDFLHLHTKGASRAEIWGSAIDAEIEASGASNIGDFAFLISNYLDIDLSGASKAELTVDGTMDIKASGASRFNYKGNGVINDLNLSGSSSVNKQ